MGRSPCCSKEGLNRGPWSNKEDNLLADYVKQHGVGQWRSLPKNAGLLRCGKSCRLRWMNYLRPGIKRGNMSEDEEDLILRLHKLLGNRWSLIAGRLPGRTDNEIKNYWNFHLRKKLKDAPGFIDPKPTLQNNKNKKKKTTKKKRTTKKRTTKKEASEDLPGEQPVTKVYMPKPIRLSSSSSAAFPRINSYDSFSSNDTSRPPPPPPPTPPPPPPPPPPEHDTFWDFLNAEQLDHHSISISDDLNTWEKVYDEYTQLL